MNKRIGVILLVCLLFMQLLPVGTAAVNENSCTIEVHYSYQNNPLVGAVFDLYRIGTVDSDGSLILSEPYASYPIDTEWLFMGASDIADLIYSYLLMDGVSPVDTISVGADGTGRKSVPEGLYLVAGRKFEDNHGYYTVEPVIVPLPLKFSAEEAGERDVIISPKTRFTPKQSVNAITRSVMKVWSDGKGEKRPQEITVCLLRDREVADRVTLSEGNRWSYRWENLSTAYEWRVAEVSVPGYTVDVDLILGVFLMTNTEKEIPPTEPTEPSETTGPTEPSETTAPTAPTEPSETTAPTAPTEPSETTAPTEPSASTNPTTNPTTEATIPTQPKPSVPKLPQTGQLWWPVAVALMVGVALLVWGALMIPWEGIIRGLLMIFAAVLLMGYGFFQMGCNLQDAQQAGIAAEETIQTMEIVMPQEVVPAKQFTTELLMLEEVPEEIAEVPYYVINPAIEMPEQEIDGVAYIGKVEIPNLQIELPVASQCRESTARTAPCRYVGSAYTKDLIICAHNYKTHFGNLSKLSVGDAVFLTDMEGNRFEYQVVEFEVMDGTAIEQMKQGDWDLTLFTCTVGGRSRFAVRCCQQ